VKSIVTEDVQRAVAADHTILGSLIRLHFHDNVRKPVLVLFVVHAFMLFRSSEQR
jgi:hypothetical protein